MTIAVKACTNVRSDMNATKKKTTSAYLFIFPRIVPPRISPFSFEKDITEGLRTQLMCSSSLGDQPFNITWLKDQRTIYTRNSNKLIDAGSIPGSDSAFDMWKSSAPSEHSQQYFVDNTIHINEYAPFSSILSIENLTSHHNGNYTCRISNQGGTVDHSAILSVAGLYKKKRTFSLLFAMQKKITRKIFVVFFSLFTLTELNDIVKKIRYA